MIESPLNYTGGKFRLLPQLLGLFPAKIRNFYDIFCGGCNVGCNVDAERVFFNDSNKILIGLFNTFKNHSLSYSMRRLDELIHSYGFSDVSKFGYEFYNCTSGAGLAQVNKDPFLKLRNDFNNLKTKNATYYYMFYLLIVFGFNNQIRFNGKGEFNLPVGKRDFNNKMRTKLSNFVQAIQTHSFTFASHDFRRIHFEAITKDDFVYADPPYLITCASYNESNGWTEHDERDLLNLLDSLNKKGISFALSNVLVNKGKTNEILKEWLNANEAYRVVHLNFDYSNSNYHCQRGLKTDEVLIVNY